LLGGGILVSFLFMEMPVRTLVGMVPRAFCSWGWSFVGFYCVERAGHRRRDDRGAPSHM
jgi:hypothetical protein